MKLLLAVDSITTLDILLDEIIASSRTPKFVGAEYGHGLRV
jgi:hypothetical protein